jgi:uridine kinase
VTGLPRYLAGGRLLGASRWRLLLTSRLRQAIVLGLLLRVLLLLLATPRTQSTWFLPFLDDVTWRDLPDPWTAFVERGGDLASFPYGPAMVLLLDLPHALGAAVGGLFGAAELGGRLGLGIVLLSADVLVLCLLRNWDPERRPLAAVLWWLSPVTIYVTYWHGQVDVLPVAALLLGLYLLRRHRAVRGGMVLGIALALKLQVLLALPFVLVYAVQFHRVRLYKVRLLAAMVVGSLPVVVAFLVSPGLRRMAFGSEETGKVLALRLSSDAGSTVLIVPLLLVLLLLAAVSLRRINITALVALVGLAYLVVLVPSPASTGWWLFVVPACALLLHDGPQRFRTVLWLFGAVFVAAQLLVERGADLPFAEIGDPLRETLPTLGPLPLPALAQTALAALALPLGYALVVNGITRTPYWRVSRRPITIGIAGDSSSGKDTLARAVAGLFGGHAVGEVLGDDYHRYERGHAMWGSVTHLDPLANDLDQMSADVATLSAGRAVVARHYDHATGRFTAPRTTASREVVLVNGLHALLLPHVRARLDVAVYLDPDDRLRQLWKLRRDVATRGASVAAVRESFVRRAPDRQRWVEPQRDLAQLVLRLVPALDDLDLAGSEDALELPALDLEPPTDGRPWPEPPLALQVRCPRSPRAARVVELLQTWCRADVELHPTTSLDVLAFTVRLGTLAPADLNALAVALLPDLEDVLAHAPEWAPSYLGVMQLLVLIAVAESRGGS